MDDNTEIVEIESKFKKFVKRHKDTLITVGIGAVGMVGILFLYNKQEQNRTDAYIDFLQETQNDLAGALDKNSDAFIDAVNTKLGNTE